jgi:hypothetical protein
MPETSAEEPSPRSTRAEGQLMSSVRLRRLLVNIHVRDYPYSELPANGAIVFRSSYFLEFYAARPFIFLLASFSGAFLPRRALNLPSVSP